MCLQQLYNELETFARSDENDTVDMSVVVLMGHGFLVNGSSYFCIDLTPFRNRNFNMSEHEHCIFNVTAECINLFKDCKLNKKPKIFIVQSCRGELSVTCLHYCSNLIKVKCCLLDFLACFFIFFFRVISAIWI